MEQTLKLLQGDFRAGKKELSRLFFVGLFFALATHFYVVEPYFLLKQQEVSFESDKISLEKSVKKITKQEKELLATKKSVHAGLERIREQINSFPNKLRDTLPDIKAAIDMRLDNNGQDLTEPQNISNSMNRPAQNNTRPPITIPKHITQFPPAVRWYINKQFQKLVTDLNQSVVSPLMNLAKREHITGAEDLDAFGREAVQQVQDHISSIDPDFWHSYGGSRGKQAVAGRIQRTIDQPFSSLEKKVEQILKQIKKLRKQQVDKVTNLENKLNTTKTKIIELSNRLETLESPFGRIPLGLTDLIKIFPFILAAMTMLLSVRLNQSLNLRSIIQEAFDHEHSTLPSSLQEYQLGGWLFPSASHKQPFIFLSLWFVVIIALSCRAAWLIGWTAIFFEAKTAHIVINQIMYKSCFAAALVLMIVAAFIGLRNLFLTPSVQTGQTSC